MSVLASTQLSRRENMQNGRNAKVVDNPMPSKRTALGTVTNIPRFQQGKSLKASASLSSISTKPFRETKSQFSIHVDLPSPKCREEQILQSEILNIAPQNCGYSENGFSPMSVSPSPCNAEKEEPGSKVRIDSESEYEDDIVRYLKKLQREHRPRVGYMEKQRDINYNMRSILVDWLVEVTEELYLKDQTLYLAVSYMDRFLSFMSVSRRKFQLVGTTCLFLAAKFEEVTMPDINDFVYMTDDTYSTQQMLRMEELILQTLRYNVSVPTALEFLEVYLVAAGCSRDALIAEKAPPADAYGRMESLARYFCELTLQDSSTFLKYLPSTVAAASVCFSARVIGLPVWNAQLEEKTGVTLEDLLNCIKDLHTAFQIAPTSSQQSIHTKYSAAKFHEVAKIDLSEDKLASL